MPLQLSSRQYVDGHGLQCPVCLGTTLEGGSITVDAGHCYQDMSCPDCVSTWTDWYVLTRYSDLEEGTPHDRNVQDRSPVCPQ